MAYMMWVGRWPNGGLDNSPPDAQLTQKAVQAWNAKYAVPRIVIGLEKEFFAEFEKRHSAQYRPTAATSRPLLGRRRRKHGA